MHLFLWAMALAHDAAERYEDSVRWAQQSIQREPSHPLPYLVLASSYVSLKRLDQARAAVQQLLRLNPAFSLAGLRLILSGADSVFSERAVGSLREAGLKE
jgi:adenylate cyclase